MNIRDVLALGMDACKALFLRGELSNRMMWVALRGAWAYVVAVASGDVAADADADSRAATCLGCPIVTSRPVAGGRVTAHYCGAPIIGGGGGCGCLVAATVDGQPIPAGLTVVASKACPAGRFPPVAAAQKS